MKKFAVMAASLSAAVLAGSLMTSASAQTIKIGVIEPLTGPFAASGNYVTNGAKIAADEINAKGGVLGQKIELVIEDNKSNPTEAASVAEKLMVRDKVPVLMGAWGSSLTLAVMPKLMEYKVPMLVETSSAGKITTSGNPYIFRISPPSAVEAVAFAKIVDKLHIGKADFLVVNNDWGRGAAEDFGKMFKDHHGRRAANAGLQTGGGAGFEEADHYHWRVAESRSVDRSSRCVGKRHHPHHLLHALEARGVRRSRDGQGVHRGMEETRLSLRRAHRELPRL
jgi:ABC-type branched-subunit amino acid transport system substrate-binding protein